MSLLVYGSKAQHSERGVNVSSSRGLFQYSNGDIFEGVLVDGKKEGMGRFRSSDGMTYQGGFKAGRAHGKGTLTYQNGSIFDGYFIDGKRSRNGFLKLNTGGLYQGKFKNGRPCGRGKMIFANRDIYVGNFVEGIMHGESAEYRFLDGTVYEGSFLNDKMSGKGTYTWSEGAVGDKTYEGEFEDGKMHGEGKLIISNDESYIGEFEDNQFHGTGKYIFANKDVFLGVYNHGNKVKGTYSFFGTSEVYVGEFDNNQFTGAGEYIWKNGQRYVGQFKSNSITGVGAYFYEDGSCAHGNFCNNMKEELRKEMGFSLYNLVKAGLLLTNAVAILHPQRFLGKYGLLEPNASDDHYQIKRQVAGLLQAVAYLQWPLLAMNCLFILIELLAGG